MGLRADFATLLILLGTPERRRWSAKRLLPRLFIWQLRPVGPDGVSVIRISGAIKGEG